LLLACLAGPAEPIEVAPITLELPTGQKTGTLTLTNRAAQKATIQVRVFAWDQNGGEDHLSPTSDIVLSPPFVTLPPNETQLVRVVLRKPAEDREASYRILIDEIPPPDAPGNVKLLLRISLPVFAEPRRKATPSLVWRVVRTQKDGMQVVGVNTGNRRARVLNLTISPEGGAAPLEVRVNANPYILPGAERRWTLKGDVASIRPGAAMRISATSDEGQISARAAVSSP
jgi:fimbrial chaperone protein